MNTEENNKSTEAKLLAPVVFWNKFEDVKPNPDKEYLVTNSDGVILVSYFDGVNWGYLCSVKENIIYWSVLPQSPFRVKL